MVEKYQHVPLLYHQRIISPFTALGRGHPSPAARPRPAPLRTCHSTLCPAKGGQQQPTPKRKTSDRSTATYKTCTCTSSCTFGPPSGAISSSGPSLPGLAGELLEVSIMSSAGSRGDGIAFTEHIESGGLGWVGVGEGRVGWCGVG